MELAEKLREPIFTPSTKAIQGEHDENISLDTVKSLIGNELAETVKEISLALYEQASQYARERGIIIADTKFEFGLSEEGELVLIDEVFTPDSSRFWPVETYQPGRSPDSFDKQYVRDYLDQAAWNRSPPAPSLPETVIDNTRKKYLEAFRLLTGQEL